MENLFWLLRKARPYLPLLFLSILGSLLQSGGATAITFLVKGIIDNVFILKEREELLKTTALLITSALVMQLGFFMSKYLVSLASERTLRDIRADIFGKLLRVPFNFFVKSKSGDIISRIVSDVDKVRQILVDQIPTLLREPFVGLALLGVLIYRDLLLTTVLIVVLPMMSFTVKFFGGKKGKHLSRTQEGTAELTQTLSQTLQGIENVKVFSAESKLFETFKRFNEKIYRSSVKAEFYITGNTVINYVSGYLVVAGVLFYGGYRILHGDITPGDFISYLTALFMVQPPILNTQKALMNLRGTLPVVKRLIDLLNTEEERSGRVEFEGLKESVEFVNASVVVDGRHILKDIKLTLRKGDRVGIVGHTGSGKSTLVKIIPRLVDYIGSVKIDGVELYEFELSSLRSRIGMATQETFLLNATVRENMLIAKPDATDTEIWQALKLALCDFVEDMDRGLDSMVGERGYSLSGGERQRLSLARLFLKNPDIVILDEATSALDMSTEKRLLKNLFEFFEGKTMLIVAHRLSNVMECNRIVVVREGTIVEEGNFYTLMERRGEFYRIFKEGKVV
ncbi:ATP-binding cassette subfamily C protein [Hydrogenivirga caldilitoris]|uniref:ATP-binding cassette subfamily C protein n=1 Tax=Hydrogenivirga caldilitoris TaxID=246264 RepID=A0A497XME3_9AQUI|nr:ABC transporter ATP-binding protein [Hydrogenivirga caldilitoris]RLJ69988.1 ATP-binding cassette subfamily C protein [Hydrogenivirga caldilitoris]